jgi:hypothetical protein
MPHRPIYLKYTRGLSDSLLAVGLFTSKKVKDNVLLWAISDGRANDSIVMLDMVNQYYRSSNIG